MVHSVNVTNNTENSTFAHDGHTIVKNNRQQSAILHTRPSWPEVGTVDIGMAKKKDYLGHLMHGPYQTI